MNLDFNFCKWIAAFLLCFIAYACSKECGCEAPPVTCMDKHFDEFIKKDNAIAVYQFSLYGEKVFLFDEHLKVSDQSLPLINFDCDTICMVGGLLPPACSKDLKDMVVLWKK